MAIFKCKMCGGALEVAEGLSVCECAYCGTTQTLPKLTDDRRANLYDRANHFHRNSEYDKAIGIYEQILNEDGSDAEAYWSLVLCKYGVEYVESPGSNKRVPTVNRVQYTSIFDDENYQCALQHADPMQQAVYAEEAKVINEIQKGILAISQQEEPYDVFICYKEKDALGNRTHDSVLAQELYYELTELGYKVFFARITLENKLGTAYEPYIFAALNSSKVMVVISTKAEYANAPWVKNEWSRYLALIKGGAKKMLIPAYKDMDAYDLPVEFAHLQVQNMEKLGFMQDLVRGIEKIVGSKKEEPKVAPAPAPAVTPNPKVESLLKRIKLFMSNGIFTEAEEYCHKVLDIDPENGEAYVYLLLLQLQCGTIEELYRQTEPLEKHPAYYQAVRYADVVTAERLLAVNAAVKKDWEKEQAVQQAQKEETQRRETWLQQTQHQNKTRLRWLNLWRWIMMIGIGYLSAVFSPMEDTDHGGVFVYIILVWLALLVPTIFGSLMYKWAVKKPILAIRMRLVCLCVTSVLASFLAIASTGGDVEYLLMAGGSAFWWVAAWFAKYDRPVTVKER